MSLYGSENRSCLIYALLLSSCLLLPGKKGYEVLVQGGVIEDLARHLIEQCGIPKKYIEVLDKTKK